MNGKFPSWVVGSLSGATVVLVTLALGPILRNAHAGRLLTRYASDLTMEDGQFVVGRAAECVRNPAIGTDLIEVLTRYNDSMTVWTKGKP